MTFTQFEKLCCALLALSLAAFLSALSVAVMIMMVTYHYG